MDHPGGNAEGIGRLRVQREEASCCRRKQRSSCDACSGLKLTHVRWRLRLVLRWHGAGCAESNDYKEVGKGKKRLGGSVQPVDISEDIVVVHLGIDPGGNGREDEGEEELEAEVGSLGSLRLWPGEEEEERQVGEERRREERGGHVSGG